MLLLTFIIVNACNCYQLLTTYNSIKDIYLLQLSFKLLSNVVLTSRNSKDATQQAATNKFEFVLFKK